MVISAFIFMGSLKHTISMVVSVWTLWPMADISISMTMVASMLSAALTFSVAARIFSVASSLLAVPLPQAVMDRVNAAPSARAATLFPVRIKVSSL